MLSNTGGGNSDSSSGAAAGAAGDPECVPEARGDGTIYGGLALGSSDAQVTKDPSQGMAGISFVGVGVVCSPDEIQGNAGGAAEIVLGRDNADIGLALGSSDARVVTKDPSQGQGTAGDGAMGDDKDDGDDDAGDGAMGSSATGYDNDDDGNGLTTTTTTC
mgnify:CR=1 FL=1